MCFLSQDQQGTSPRARGESGLGHGPCLADEDLSGCTVGTAL